MRPGLSAIDNNVNPKECLGGSDYIFPLGEHEPGKLILESAFSDDSKNDLLNRAALEWLKLDKGIFTT